MRAPLSGIKVLDFTRVLAGPHCSRQLADLGADVLKVEPPGFGDVARFAVPSSGNHSHYFAQQNAGKRNICLDLNVSEAREVALELCKSVDIVLENFRPGTLRAFGLSYQEVSAENPGVIYASISGYGQTGPWRSRPAFAPTIHAEMGFTDILLRHYGDALKVPTNDGHSHADVYTGLETTIAVLAALHQRTETGVGQHVDVSMMATMLSVNERTHAEWSDVDIGSEPVALGAPESPIFEMADGTKICISASPVFTPIFLRFSAMMRRNDLRSDPRFVTAEARRTNLEELLSEIRAWVTTFGDFAELEAQVAEAGLAAGIVRTMRDLADTEWAREWGAVVELDDGAGGPIRIPGAPWKFSEAQLEPPSFVALRGEHNDEVLSELGFDEDARKRLAAMGAVSQDPRVDSV